MLTISQFLTNADVNFAFDGSLVQWSEVPVVPGVGICSMLQQDGYHLSMTKGTGIVKGNQSTVILNVHFSPILYQIFNHIVAAKP